MSLSPKHLAMLLCGIIAVTACGCGMLEEDAITPGEIAAARDIKVNITSQAYDLTFRPPLAYIRGSRLIVEVMFHNASRASAGTLVYDVYLFDNKGQPLEYDDVYTRTFPETIFPNSTGTAKIDVPASQVATVIIRVRMSICGQAGPAPKRGVCVHSKTRFAICCGASPPILDYHPNLRYNSG